MEFSVLYKLQSIEGQGLVDTMLSPLKFVSVTGVPRWIHRLRDEAQDSIPHLGFVLFLCEGVEEALPFRIRRINVPDVAFSKDMAKFGSGQPEVCVCEYLAE